MTLPFILTFAPSTGARGPLLHRILPYVCTSATSIGSCLIFALYLYRLQLTVRWAKSRTSKLIAIKDSDPTSESANQGGMHTILNFQLSLSKQNMDPPDSVPTRKHDDFLESSRRRSRQGISRAGRVTGREIGRGRNNSTCARYKYHIQSGPLPASRVRGCSAFGLDPCL